MRRLHPQSVLLAPTKNDLDYSPFREGSARDSLGARPAHRPRTVRTGRETCTRWTELRTLGVLANTLPRQFSDRLAKWLRGGQFGFLFDNPQDSISLSRFQCFDFQQMSRYPELLEPLLFYILHRANEVITNREVSSTFKSFFIDEAWVFLRNPSIRQYVTEALKTWRKHNAAMILSTQSLDELKRSELLDVIVESCATKIFLANPDMDQDLYRRQFHLNDTELDSSQR
jgi:type IV secretion system protein VirB4